LPFGVRRYPDPIPADTDFYACPLCTFVTTDKKAMTDHLYQEHGVKKNDAKALVEQIATLP
jgi:uncharacterized C2H2 Zn-finger protein